MPNNVMLTAEINGEFCPEGAESDADDAATLRAVQASTNNWMYLNGPFTSVDAPPHKICVQVPEDDADDTIRVLQQNLGRKCGRIR